MGQAKRRGTFDQRLSAALAVKPLEDHIVNDLAKGNEVLPSKIRKRLGFALLAALVIDSVRSRNLTSADLATNESSQP